MPMRRSIGLAFTPAVRPVRSMKRKSSGSTSRFERYCKKGSSDGGRRFRIIWMLTVRRGTNAANLRVYGKGGKAVCEECGCPLERVVIAGRGTHFCPGCQQDEGR